MQRRRVVCVVDISAWCWFDSFAWTPTLTAGSAPSPAPQDDWRLRLVPGWWVAQVLVGYHGGGGDSAAATCVIFEAARTVLGVTSCFC